MKNRIFNFKMIFSLLVFLLIPFTPIDSHASTSEAVVVPVAISQNFTQQTITYQLTSLTADAPLPEESTDGRFTIENQATKTLHFSFVTPGRYRYQLTPVTQNILSQLPKEQQSYEIEIIVYYDQQVSPMKSIISAENSTGYKVDTIQFEKLITTPEKEHFGLPVAGTAENTSKSHGLFPQTGSIGGINNLMLLGIVLLLLWLLVVIKRRFQKQETDEKM